MMRLLLSIVDFPSILAGHGYDLGRSPSGDSGGDDGGGGLSLPWIVAVLVLTLFAVGLLVSLTPAATRAKLKPVAAPVLILIVIGAPLIAWTASSRGGDRRLIVEHGVAVVSGAPELILSLGDGDLNTLETTDGKRVVRVECVDRQGHSVLDGEQKWPFVEEPGYDYAHAHQAASREQLRRVERCRLAGTRVRLEAEVTGALAR